MGEEGEEKQSRLVDLKSTEWLKCPVVWVHRVAEITVTYSRVNVPSVVEIIMYSSLHECTLLIVNWYFEPSQPQRIISRLKTMFSPSPIHSARKSSNQKLFKNHKISPVHKFISNKTYTNIEHKIFEELIPSVSPLLKKHIRLGHVGIVDHSVDLSLPDRGNNFPFFYL